MKLSHDVPEHVRDRHCLFNFLSLPFVGRRELDLGLSFRVFLEEGINLVARNPAAAEGRTVPTTSPMIGLPILVIVVPTAVKSASFVPETSLMALVPTFVRPTRKSQKPFPPGCFVARDL